MIFGGMKYECKSSKNDPSQPCLRRNVIPCRLAEALFHVTSAAASFHVTFIAFRLILLSPDKAAEPYAQLKQKDHGYSNHNL